MDRAERRRKAAREWNRRNPEKVKAAKAKRMECPEYRKKFAEYQRAYWYEVRKIRMYDNKENE